MARTTHDRDVDESVDRKDVDRDDVARNDDTVVTEERTDGSYEKFGGANLGAAFFGWIVATGISVLLIGIIGAIAAGVGDANDITQSDAERSAGTVGLTSAIVLVVVLLIGYYAGGYVAGRMSRFDGARQGVVTWLIGLVVTVVAVAAGWVFGDKYNVMDRVDLPRIPIPDDQLTQGGVITGVVIVVGTLLAAAAGGRVGRHYHDRVDRYAEV
jgi:hypothetical protein